jgi:hypothetical protein
LRRAVRGRAVRGDQDDGETTRENANLFLQRSSAERSQRTAKRGYRNHDGDTRTCKRTVVPSKTVVRLGVSLAHGVRSRDPLLSFDCPASLRFGLSRCSFFSVRWPVSPRQRGRCVAPADPSCGIRVSSPVEQPVAFFSSSFLLRYVLGTVQPQRTSSKSALLALAAP